jgi:myo-inositol 2-dehydrogenase / D-chiro-inositol 1-dehydrogenase
MISVGLIGCGDVAESGHLPTLLSDDRFSLAAVCDVNLIRAQLFSSRAGGISVYTDWRQLLARENTLDAVVLALPPEISPEVVDECLRRNLAVLDEKPFAADVAAGRRLKQAIDESAGVYQVGFVLRYGAWVDKIHELIPRLGQPLQIQVEIYDEQYCPDDPVHLARIDGFIKNSSALTHEGSHVVDYVNVWNPAAWVRASATSRQTAPEFAGPNLWNAHVDFDNGSTLNMKIGWLLPEWRPSTVEIVGTEGRLDFNCTTGSGHIEVAGVEEHFTTTALAPDWQRQYDTFATAIERWTSLAATVDDGFRALQITAACELSAQLGSSIEPADLAEDIRTLRVDREETAAPAALGREQRITAP